MRKLAFIIILFTIHSSTMAQSIEKLLMSKSWEWVDFDDSIGWIMPSDTLFCARSLYFIDSNKLQFWTARQCGISDPYNGTFNINRHRKVIHLTWTTNRFDSIQDKFIADSFRQSYTYEVKFGKEMPCIELLDNLISCDSGFKVIPIILTLKKLDNSDIIIKYKAYKYFHNKAFRKQRRLAKINNKYHTMKK